MDIFKLITGGYDKQDDILKYTKIIGTDDALFYTDTMFIDTVAEVESHYKYYDLRPTDIVLDIGTCIGAFSLKVNKKVSRVYSIEPTMGKELKRNIFLNNANNITVYEYALGDGNDITIDWHGNIKTVKSYSLTDIISMCGGHIDFMKCDCEGGEWNIKPDEIKNIRRIEMEVHDTDNDHPLSYFEDMLNNNGFTYTTIPLSYNLFLISAKKKIDNEAINNPYASEMNIFEARNRIHERIKKSPGFIGVNFNTKTGIRGVLTIYTKNKEAKESLHKIIGDIQYGYYIEYNIQEGLKFS